MTPIMKSPSNGQIIEIHEERISRLEDGIKDCIIKTVEQSSKIELLSNKFEDGISRIIEKFDIYVTSLSEKLFEHTQEDKNISQKVLDKLEDNSNRMQHLEIKDLARNERSRITRKYIWPLCLACGGVLATKLGELIWSWLSHS